MDVSVLLKLFLGCGKPQEPAILYFSCSHHEQRQLFKNETAAALAFDQLLIIVILF